MARNAETAPYNSALWHKLVSLAYFASRPKLSIFISWVLEAFRWMYCYGNAVALSARSSWLHSSPLPNDCYLSWNMNLLLQRLFILASLESVVAPVCTIAFCITIFRRETTHTEDILFIGLLAISTVVAAVVLALQTMAMKSSLDMQAILKIRPDLSSEDVLTAWNGFIGNAYARAALVCSLVIGGFQIMAISARHLIPSPMRIPKQFQPFVILKHKRTSAVGQPEASTVGTELVAGEDSGLLAKLFNDYEKQGLISTHIELKPSNTEDFTRPVIKGRSPETRRRLAFPEDRTDDGPRFTLADRYWGPQMYGFQLKMFILSTTLYFLLTVSFETVQFATRRSIQPCQWLHILGPIYPWPLAIWVVTVLISVQYRFALQRRVLGTIPQDTLLVIGYIISLIPAAVHGVATYIISNDYPEDYTDWDTINSFCTTMFVVPMMALLSAFLGYFSLIKALKYLISKLVRSFYI